MTEPTPLTNDEFWSRVTTVAAALNIPAPTVRVWKHRGRVSHTRLIDLHTTSMSLGAPLALTDLQKQREAVGS